MKRPAELMSKSLDAWRAIVNPAICRLVGHIEYRYEPLTVSTLQRLVWCRRCGKLPENW